jgi:cytochrome b561
MRILLDCRTNGKLPVNGQRQSSPLLEVHLGDELVLKVSRYHPLLVVLHWLLALIIVAALALGAAVLVKIPNSSPMKIEGLRSHAIGGMLILALMIVRLMIRTYTAHPAPASAGHPALDWLAWASHRLMYLTVMLMPVTGIVMALQSGMFNVIFFGHGTLPADFWVFPIRSVHYLLSRVLMALISLHIVAALYHAFVLRDGLLRRMSFGQRFSDDGGYRLATDLKTSSSQR